ncbi:GNAT family N-acetyltransferase [Pseudomonas kermanshahensis]|uniref:GNAT family N-acetyltransferase n=1 Tax=Pseudomonas kermanshahensis TaxID=2745482 RepID=UPI002092D4CB|nr:GNAT family N-acetyltransferase [Pseudomonas kermanshahensis]USS53617.1 GNAT family N-acetyltransferase [Pseudomonas kermanshahensis]
MKQHLAAVARKLISPSTRYEIRLLASQVREVLGRACFWRWEVARFRLQQESPYEILYIGRKQQREMAKLLIGGKAPGNAPVAASSAAPDASNHVVVVSEMPTTGALSVPHYLSAVVPLGRALDDITARYDSELRRSIRKNRPLYQMRQALSDEEIAMADSQLLRPYATARQGIHAAQFPTDDVFRIAKSVGRLDLITLGDEVIGCHLGCEVTRGGKRYWSTLRFGYSEAVFSDAKKLREVNSITTFMALEWALQHGFDYYDIGLCLARPDDGLLKWKRRRGGDIDSLGNHAYLFVRLPKTGTAKFLWETPMFAVEGDKLTLHLGLPDGPSDEEVASRYHEMVFGGLHKIYLYGDKRSGESFIETLRTRYANLQSPPTMERITSN